jgi:hypothetical protein
MPFIKVDLSGVTSRVIVEHFDNTAIASSKTMEQCLLSRVRLVWLGSVD